MCLATQRGWGTCQYQPIYTSPASNETQVNSCHKSLLCHYLPFQLKWSMQMLINLSVRKWFSSQGQGVLSVRFVRLSIWGRGLLTREATQDKESQGFRHERDKISGMLLLSWPKDNPVEPTPLNWRIHVRCFVHQDEFLELTRLASGSFGSVVKVHTIYNSRSLQLKWGYLDCEGSPPVGWSCLCSEDYQEETKTQQQRWEGSVKWD